MSYLGLCVQGESAEFPSLGGNFMGGISVNQGTYQAQIVQYLCNEVDVSGEILVTPDHIGQTADIFVWAKSTLPPDETLYYFM